jgi:hypothetical protein
MFSKKEIKGIKNKANKKEYNNYSFMTTERPPGKDPLDNPSTKCSQKRNKRH